MEVIMEIELASSDRIDFQKVKSEWTISIMGCMPYEFHGCKTWQINQLGDNACLLANRRANIDFFLLQFIYGTQCQKQSVYWGIIPYQNGYTLFTLSQVLIAVTKVCFTSCLTLTFITINESTTHGTITSDYQLIDFSWHHSKELYC
jgi:hypothetical protein